MRPLTRLAAAAIGVLALAAPAYAQHSAGSQGLLGGSGSTGVLRPMPRPAGFSVYPGTYGYNPGYIGAISDFSQPAYKATQYQNGQRVEGIISNGTFYAKSGTQQTTTAPRSSSKSTKDSRPSPNPSGNLGNKGGSAKGGKGNRK